MPEDHDDNAPHDPLPALMAQIDQALEMAGEVARMAKSQYDAYRAESFTDKQSLYLAACSMNPPQAPGE